MTVPTTVVAVAVLLALALPGYVFQTRLRRRTPEVSRSTFEEVLIILFSGVAVDVAVLGLAAGLNSWLRIPYPQFNDLITTPGTYVAQHLEEVVLWLTGLLSAAVVLAFVMSGAWWGRLAPKAMRKSSERRRRANPAKSAWWLLFTEHPGHTVYVGCMLTDGGYLAGRLHSFSTLATETRDRELTLRGEIRYRPPKSTDEPVVLPNVNAASVSAERIQVLTVTYLDPPAPDSDEGGGDDDSP